jgi:catechol 2,3-dioxygenase-like lactoylglutathione lyase family enzyme
MFVVARAGYPSGMPVRRAAIDHLTIGVSNVERSKAFYEAILAPLGLTHTQTSGVLPGEVEFGTESEHAFAISTAYSTGAPVHVAFGADSIEQVQAFYEAALAAGGIDNGAPGLRPEYSPVYYGAFVLDPDGHNVEAIVRV